MGALKPPASRRSHSGFDDQGLVRGHGRGHGQGHDPLLLPATISIARRRNSGSLDLSAASITVCDVRSISTSARISALRTCVLVSVWNALITASAVPRS